MAEVLSQNEIDALLSALSSGEIVEDDIIKEEEKQKVKLYDFGSPQKFSKDHIRTLELIHDNFSRIISNFLTAQVRSNVKVNIVSVQQITYEEFIMEVSIEVEGIETNPALNQTLAPKEPVALITFSVEMGKSSSFINLCIPYLSIEKFLDKLVVQYWFQSSDDESMNASRELIRNRLNVVDVTLSAVLSSTHITVDEFLKLSVDDVITLDNACTSPITVKVEEENCYLAKPGLIGKNYGVTILDIIDKDVEINE